MNYIRIDEGAFEVNLETPFGPFFFISYNGDPAGSEGLDHFGGFELIVFGREFRFNPWSAEL